MGLTLAPATHLCVYVQVCPQPYGGRVDYGPGMRHTEDVDVNVGR